MGERGKSWHFWQRTRGKATAVLRQWRGSFFPVVREDFSSGAANFSQWWEKIFPVVGENFGSGGSFVWSGRGRLDRFTWDNFWEGGLKFGLKYGIICAVLICQDEYSMINSKEERLGK